MKKRKFVFLWLVPFIPFVLAFIVFLYYYGTGGYYWLTAITNAAYDAVRIYSMTIADSGKAVAGFITIEGPYKGLFYLMLDIARFGGIVVLGAAFFKLFRDSIENMATYLKGSDPKNYALYGDASSISLLKKQLKGRALPLNNPELFYARNHIVAFRDHNKTLAFLSENLTKMLANKENKIYIYTNGAIHSEHLNSHLIINNCAKNCARLYWKQDYLRADEKVVVLFGFERYGEELLTHALQNNVFLENRSIKYHVFGDGAKYMAQHPQLSQFLTINKVDDSGDSLFFHSEQWYEEKELINSADRFILCYDKDEENLSMLNEMRSANMRNGKKYDIRLNSTVLLKELWELNANQVNVFGTDKELYTLDQATNSELYAKGRLVHAYYYGMQNGKTPLECLKDPDFQHDWETTSHYNRCSSIAQDDHSDIKVRELLGNDNVRLTEESTHKAAQRYAELSREEKIPYLEMEHRRWCRFLWMNGWSYDSVRDNSKRHHHLLVPFNKLSEKEVFKDENAYFILKDAGEKL